MLGRKPKYDYSRLPELAKVMSLNKAAKELGIGYETLCSYARWHGIKSAVSKHWNQKHDYSDIPKMLEDMTLAEASRKSGIPYPTLVCHVRNHKIDHIPKSDAVRMGVARGLGRRQSRLTVIQSDIRVLQAVHHNMVKERMVWDMFNREYGIPTVENLITTYDESITNIKYELESKRTMLARVRYKVQV